MGVSALKHCGKHATVEGLYSSLRDTTHRQFRIPFPRLAHCHPAFLGSSSAGRQGATKECTSPDQILLGSGCVPGKPHPVETSDIPKNTEIGPTSRDSPIQFSTHHFLLPSVGSSTRGRSPAG